jgi:hypothetical protein
MKFRLLDEDIVADSLRPTRRVLKSVGRSGRKFQGNHEEGKGFIQR